MRVPIEGFWNWELDTTILLNTRSSIGVIKVEAEKNRERISPHAAYRSFSPFLNSMSATFLATVTPPSQPRPRIRASATPLNSQSLPHATLFLAEYKLWYCHHVSRVSAPPIGHVTSAAVSCNVCIDTCSASPMPAAAQSHTHGPTFTQIPAEFWPAGGLQIQDWPSDIKTITSWQWRTALITTKNLAQMLVISWRSGDKKWPMVSVSSNGGWVLPSVLLGPAGPVAKSPDMWWWNYPGVETGHRWSRPHCPL